MTEYEPLNQLRFGLARRFAPMTTWMGALAWAMRGECLCRGSFQEVNFPHPIIKSSSSFFLFFASEEASFRAADSPPAQDSHKNIFYWLETDVDKHKRIKCSKFACALEWQDSKPKCIFNNFLSNLSLIIKSGIKLHLIFMLHVQVIHLEEKHSCSKLQMIGITFLRALDHLHP